MAINNFIPQVWSAALLQNLHKTLVYGQLGVINRLYEGQIRQQGDTVKITAIGPVSVSDYAKNTDIGGAETLSDAQTVLVVDRQKYFHFFIDDVDDAQAAGDVLEEAMRESGYALRNAADQYLATLMTDGASSDNYIGSSGSPKTDLGSEGAAYEYLVDLSVTLDETDTPEEGRWAVVPPWFHGELLKDERFVRAGTAQSDDILRNGLVGQAAGFTIFKTTNVPITGGTVYKVLAGIGMATTYAEQIVSVEAYRPEKRFGDAMKGLHVYGAKVIRPSQLALLWAARPA
jgi:N4-gp56 family major capsid protein